MMPLRRSNLAGRLPCIILAIVVKLTHIRVAEVRENLPKPSQYAMAATRYHQRSWLLG